MYFSFNNTMSFSLQRRYQVETFPGVWELLIPCLTCKNSFAQNTFDWDAHYQTCTVPKIKEHYNNFIERHKGKCTKSELDALYRQGKEL